MIRRRSGTSTRSVYSPRSTRSRGNSLPLRSASVWAGLFLALRLCAQVQNESPAPDRTYNLLRENDDWSFLVDPSLRSDFWDPIKYIPLGCDGRNINYMEFWAGYKF